MTTNVTLIAPSGTTGLVDVGGGSTYAIGSDGTVSVPFQYVSKLLNAGFQYFRTNVVQAFFEAPLPADLVSISAAAIATNRALTIAAQPVHARKLQIRQVIVTAITAGVLTLVGTDQDGNAVTETVSLIASVTQTLKSKYAYGHLTSATVTGLVGGGDGTLGLGVSNDFGVAGGQVTGAQVVDMTVVKATKATKVLGTSITAADDVASTATVDSAARTVAPTTNPAASGLVDFSFTVTFGLAD